MCEIAFINKDYACIDVPMCVCVFWEKTTEPTWKGVFF